MKKLCLAILTESIRFDNQHALKYFTKMEPVHFYENAPYGDLKPEELKNAIQYRDLNDLEAKILALKPDIIQGAEPYASRKALKLCQVAYKISQKQKIPLIFGMLENRPVRSRFGLLAPIMKAILKKYTKQASLIFYLNEGAKKNLLEVGVDKDKLVKLLYGIWGVDTTIYKPIPEIEKKQKILVMGRLDEAKGLPYVVEAWKSIAHKFPQVSIEFSGKGELEHLIDGPRMSHNFYKNSDLPKLINGALFTITASVTLPKWEEQVGMTNLQALACGVPVITTNSGAIPEYINPEVGILVPERDSRALAQAMQKLLNNDKLRMKLAQNAIKYIQINYSAQKTIEKTENILLSLLE
jgi:glycosyltransferase involved in cell wall biosynthesis